MTEPNAPRRLVARTTLRGRVLKIYRDGPRGRRISQRNRATAASEIPKLP